MNRHRPTVVSALILAATGGAAWAQTPAPSQAQQPAILEPAVRVAPVETPEDATPERLSVLDRPRPDYDPLGGRVDTFLWYPSAELEGTFDSNVFATHAGTKDDFFTTLRPGMELRSDWSTNALNFQTSGEIKRYSKLVSENQSNLAAASNGRLDVEENIYFVAGASYQLLHEDRSSPDTVANQKNPIEYQLSSVNLGYVRQPGRLGFRIDGQIDSYAYGNGTTATGVTIVETDRNRTVYTVTPRLNYEITPGYTAFIKAPINWRDYQAQYDQNGYNRTSNGYEVDAGTALKLSNLMSGEFYIGYLNQDYNTGRSPLIPIAPANAPPLRGVSGLSIGGNVLWNVTQLTSLRAALQRSVEEAVFSPPASSYVQTALSVTVEHELQRNVLLTGLFGYINQDYQGLNRTDDNFQADVGVRYLLNRYLSTSLNASYRKRSSNIGYADYDREIITARLRAQF